MDKGLMLSIGMLVYYLSLQLYSDFIRSGMSHNTKNSLIEKLRIDYKVNIRTFQKNNALQGFAWFTTIWLNENLFRNKDKLMFVFHHEYYHLKHKHKAWLLLMRFILSTVPALIFNFTPWWMLLALMLNLSFLIEKVRLSFEKSANEHAYKMTDGNKGRQK